MEGEAVVVETGAGSAETGTKVKVKKKIKTGGKVHKLAARAKPRTQVRRVLATTYKRGAGKVGMALTPAVAKLVRRLRAQLEMKSGDRVTIAAAVEHAVKAVMK